jgi:aspartate carbamoyltransferase catalytic subunit
MTEMNNEQTVLLDDSKNHVQWSRKHLLDINDFTTAEYDLVLETAAAMKEILSRPIKKVPALRGKTIATLFYEASTRTKSSFEMAAKNLSADVINLAASSSSITKGESLVDTLHTLQAMGVNGVVIRHSMAGAPYLAAEHAQVSIINAGDGWHAHPTQALLDMFTVFEKKRRLKGLKVTILGDSRYSRVARSNIWGFSGVGAKVTLCAPPTLLPPGMGYKYAPYPGIEIETDIEKALEGADVVMVLRLQKERQQAGLIPDIREYIQSYQLTSARFAFANPHAILMHPGPVNENIEISPDMVRCPASVIDQQVTNGIAVRMALLYLVIGGKKDEK